jgi:CubicO group peptidase (beta-lactamase class C family)
MLASRRRALYSVPMTAAVSQVRASLHDFFCRMESHGFSGAVLVADRGEILLESGYGLAIPQYGVSVTPDTAFDIGSLTMQFTAAAVLRLEMEGALRTADAIRLHLETFIAGHGWTMRVPKEIGRLTIDQLLSHDAPLPRVEPEKFDSELDYLRAILDASVDRTQGEARISSCGYDLLGWIIASAAGQSLERVLASRLFRPAGMKDSGHRSQSWNRNQVAEYHDWITRRSGFQGGSPLERSGASFLRGSSGLLSSVRDLHRWRLALQGDLILSAEAIAKFHALQADDSAPGALRDRQSSGVSGFDPVLGACFLDWHYPGEDLRLIVLANTTLNEQLEPDWLRRQIEGILLGGPVVFPPRSSARGTVSVARYAGAWVFDDLGILTTWQEQGRLRADTESRPLMLALIFPGVEKRADTEATRSIVFELLDCLARESLESFSLPLAAGIDVEDYTTRMSDWWRRQYAPGGRLVDVRVLHQQSGEHRGTLQTWSFVTVELERDVHLIRATVDASGQWLFEWEPLPERLELTPAPLGDGRFSAWNCLYETGTELEFQGENAEEMRLRIQGRDRSSEGRRIAT